MSADAITIYKMSNANRWYPVAKSHQDHQGSQREQLWTLVEQLWTLVESMDLSGNNYGKFSLFWIFFLNSGFLTTCACPENRVSPEIFHCIEYIFTIQDFWATALALKNRVALEFFTVLNMYFLSFRIFEQLALALKNRVALKIFTVWNIHFTFRIFE